MRGWQLFKNKRRIPGAVWVLELHLTGEGGHIPRQEFAIPLRRNLCNSGVFIDIQAGSGNAIDDDEELKALWGEVSNNLYSLLVRRPGFSLVNGPVVSKQHGWLDLC